MKQRIVILALIVGVALLSLSFVTTLARLNLPGNHAGYRPAQPLAYSHRVHAGELQIPCLYCHAGAERSRSAGVPSANICMNCHRYVSASLGALREEDRLAGEEGREPRRLVSPELQKLYDALGLDENLAPDPDRARVPIEWARVH